MAAENHASWKNRELPFYVVLEDISTSTSSDSSEPAEFKSINYGALVPRRQEHDLDPCGLFERPVNIYPEVKYRFLDDTDEDDNLNESDSVLILDFDESGEQVTDIKSLNQNWQPYRLDKVRNHQISATQSDRLNGPTSIIITGTRSSVKVKLQKKNSEEQKEDDLDLSIENIRNLVQIFNTRNQQLEKMVQLSQLLPK